jgi:glutamate racemase
MDNRSIGIFDSGVGGLTVVKEISKRSPYENIIYFGDTARVPYGTKSRETILKYSIENALFLIEKNIKLLVVACNTASAYAVPYLQKTFQVPVLGVIEPGIEAALAATKKGSIAVLGTKATIESGAYQDGIKVRNSDIEVIAKACPLFVPLVEEGMIDHPIVEMVVEEYLNGIEADTILLACTHYPLLKNVIEKVTGKVVVDSACSCAEFTEKILDKTSNQLPGEHSFFVSDNPAKFQLPSWF